MCINLYQQAFLAPLPENRVHPRVTKSKHHAYTTNTTFTKELQGLKYSKESRKPKEQYEQDAHLN
jgi:hypothetical protein